MRHIKRIGVIAAGVALLVSGSLGGRHEYHPFGDELVAASGAGGPVIYKNGQRVGAIGISGDGIDQDDLIGAVRPIRPNGDGSDHSWSLAFIVGEHFPADSAQRRAAPLAGVAA